MKTLYSRGIAVFLFFLAQAVFSEAASAHEDFISHKVFKAIGDAHRALMDTKNGMGGSMFTLYVSLSSVVTAEASGKSGIADLGTKLGGAFIPECRLCNGQYLLTNQHVADIKAVKEKYEKMIKKAVTFPPGVGFRLTESYKAVDLNGVVFNVTLVATSKTDDIALFRFSKQGKSFRKSFILQDESEISFSPIGIVGSPSDIDGTLRTANIARATLDDCGGEEHRYLMLAGLISPGNSGGLVYNFESDKVNGMATAAVVYDEMNTGISCAVPASALIKFLDETVPLRKKIEMVNGG